MPDSEKFSFNDLIKHQWFGSKVFQVFSNEKACASESESSNNTDLNEQETENPTIIEIQISKNIFNKQEVKLFLVRSLDFLISI